VTSAAISSGELLRSARTNAGLTPEQLESKAGLQPGSVGAYEAGKNALTLTALQVLVAATGLELSVTLRNPASAGGNERPAPDSSRSRAVHVVLSLLTPRQRQLLRRVELGGTNRQVASDLGVAEGTVRKHLEHIYTRLDVHSRTEAVALLHASAGT